MVKFDQLHRKVNSFLKFAQDASGLTDTSAVKMAAEVLTGSINEWVKNEKVTMRAPGVAFPLNWKGPLAYIKSCSTKVGSLTNEELKSLLSSATEIDYIPEHFGTPEDKQDWIQMVQPEIKSLISVIGDCLSITPAPRQSTFA